MLAPTADILNEYTKKRISWDQFEFRFLTLMRERQVETKLDPFSFDEACLLCSEDAPDKCHRRLVVEYLGKHWKEIEVSHLV